MAKPSDILAECGYDVKIMKVNGELQACTHCARQIPRSIYAIAFGKYHDGYYSNRHDNIYMHVHCFEDFKKTVAGCIKACKDPILFSGIKSRMREAIKGDVKDIPKIRSQLKMIYDDFKKLKIPYPAADVLTEFGHDNDISKAWYSETCPACNQIVLRGSYGVWLFGRARSGSKIKKQSHVILHPDCVDVVNKSVSVAINLHKEIIKKNMLECAAAAL